MDEGGEGSWGGGGEALERMLLAHFDEELQTSAGLFFNTIE